MSVRRFCDVCDRDLEGVSGVYSFRLARRYGPIPEGMSPKALEFQDVCDYCAHQIRLVASPNLTEAGS